MTIESNQLPVKKRKSIKQFLTDFPYIQVALIVGVILAVFLIPKNTNLTAGKKSLSQGWMTINPPKKTTCILQWKDYAIAGDNEGVYKINLDTGKVNEKFAPKISMEYVRALMVDKNDCLWVCHINGASKFNGKSWENFSIKNGLPDNRANCIMQDSKGLIWVGTSKGIGIYDGKAWRSMTTKDGLISDMVNAIAQHTNGTMFFGSYLTNIGGVSCFYNGKWQYFNTKNGLPHDYINCFYQDSNKGMWVGTGFLERGGTCKLVFENGKWAISKVLTVKEGLAGEKVCAIFEQKNDGIMWFGSEYDGISFNKNGEWSSIDYLDGLAGCEVKSILFDKNQTMWFATPDGVSRITDKALKETIKAHLGE
ncbi:MAG: two-component regulator propeller domain-containing protein [Ignavibacteriales bacterium]